MYGTDAAGCMVTYARRSLRYSCRLVARGAVYRRVDVPGTPLARSASAITSRPATMIAMQLLAVTFAVGVIPHVVAESGVDVRRLQGGQVASLAACAADLNLVRALHHISKPLARAVATARLTLIARASPRTKS